MRKLKKLTAAVLAGVMLVAFCGCGGQTVDNKVSAVQWQKAADVAALELLVDETGEDGYIAQIPQFANADDNAVLAVMNERLQEKADDYEQGKADGVVQEFVPLVLDNDNYLSVVLYESEQPSEDTDGKVSAYVWDKTLNVEVDEDLAFSMAGATDDGVADALATYCADKLSADGVEYRWTAFGVSGYFVDTDGKTGLVLSVDIKPIVDEPKIREHLLVYKNGQILSNLTEDLAQVK